MRWRFSLVALLVAGTVSAQEVQVVVASRIRGRRPRPGLTASRS